jgi:hypothetical protein
MAKRPYFRYPAAIIIWNDAHARNQAVEYEESELIQQHRPEECKTLGLVVTDDEAGITIYNEQTGPSSVRGVSFIPKAMLKSVTYVNLTPRKKAKDERPIPLPDIDAGNPISGERKP